MVDKYEQFKSYIERTGTTNVQLAVQNFEKSLKESEIRHLKTFILEDVQKVRERLQATDSIEDLNKIGKLLATALEIGTSSETYSHPLDPAIAYVKTQGDKYRHTDPECVVSNFTPKSAILDDKVTKFAVMFGISREDANSLYFGNFGEIREGLKDFNTGTQKDVTAVKGKHVIETLEVLKEKYPVDFVRQQVEARYAGRGLVINYD